MITIHHSIAWHGREEEEEEVGGPGGGGFSSDALLWILFSPTSLVSSSNYQIAIKMGQRENPRT
jgi:hypothetical protein